MSSVLDLVATPDMQAAISQLPAYVQRCFAPDHVAELQEELADLARGKKALAVLPRHRPVYQEREQRLTAELAGIKRMLTALTLGYEPYAVPQNWYVGRLARPTRVSRFFNSALGIENTIPLAYHSPIPPEVLVKLKSARGAKVFDEILIASPERSAFRVIEPMRIDPVMVGYISLGNMRLRASRAIAGIDVTNGCGFAIARWGLKEDRRRAGLDF